MTTTRSVIIEKELPHPPEKIWRALTQGALIKEWLMDNDFEAQIGHRFQFRSAPVANWNGIIDSQVLELEPHKKLSYRWAAFGMDTVVIWTLTATPGGTLLRMEHSGFRADQEANYQGATYGWRKFIGNLERVLDAPA
jgi:uncharacterized protein YndB with AHSA1/START domain